MTAGPPEAFESWYRREHEAFVRALWSITGDREAARDLAAESFSRALERWDRVGIMASPGGWTWRVAINLSRRRHRRASLERAVLRGDRPDDVVLDDQRDLDLWQAVAALPRREREAVALRYVAGLGEAQVAETMGISEGAASASLSSARRRLQRTLRIEAEEPDHVG